MPTNNLREPREGDISAVLRPLESLIGKSDKAKQKLSAGTWQHTMLTNNLTALRLAYRLITEGSAAFTEEDLQQLPAALAALSDMIARAEKAQTKFSEGTAQHTLQQNRIFALRTAMSYIEKAASVSPNTDASYLANIARKTSVQLSGNCWRVLDVQPGRALLLSELILNKLPFNADYDDVRWAACSLRAYLNDGFLSHFSAEVQARLLTVHLDDGLTAGVAGNETPCLDRVFLLSTSEAVLYLASDLERATTYQGNAKPWWLRSKGIGCHAAFVGSDGVINTHGYRVDNPHCGVRPAIWVRL